jgi:hypothetical protein
MDPRPIEQWQKILGDLPAPNGENAEYIMAQRIIGDFVGYEHPGGNARTRERRTAIRQRDAQELAHALQAYGRMMFDAGVRP